MALLVSRAGNIIVSLLLMVVLVGEAFAETAVISFSAPTKDTNGNALPAGTQLEYDVYQGLKGQAKVKVGTISTTGATITAGLAGGNEYCWQVVARIVGGKESALSNEACKSFPAPTPEAVEITVT